MSLTQAFWTVINKIINVRPILLGCCDCNATYYLTKNQVIRKIRDKNGNKNPIISCPYCGLEHLVLLVRLTENTIGVRYEIDEGS